MTKMNKAEMRKGSRAVPKNKKVTEASTEQGLDDNKPIIITGVKGMKSTSFRKKFRNMAAYDKWSDSEVAGDFEVQYVMNEATGNVEMCPTACCGEPVTECKCSADCEHCDCHAKNKARMNEADNDEQQKTDRNAKMPPTAAERRAKAGKTSPQSRNAKMPPTAAERRAKKNARMNEDADKYRVVAKSNDDDSTFKSGIQTKAAADVTAAKMKKAKRKDGAKMYNSIKVVTESKKTIREGVLDDMDDDGFMAKRQLYDLAKYAVELHRQIQDTDDLEPWVSAKITKAQDYISTVKHYMEYNAMRGAEDTADQMGAMDMADMDAVEVQVGDVGDVKYATTEDLMADADPYVEEAQTLNGMDVLRMALGRGIISQNQFNDPEEILMGMADGMADMLTHNDVKNSADISMLMKEFVTTAESQLVLLMGPKVDAYYGMTEAKRIYEKMMRGIKGKK